MIADEALLVESEAKYRKIFDNANISIWEEDSSALIDSFEKMKKAGITDLKKHLDDNPGLDWELAGKVKILDVNEATLRLFDVQKLPFSMFQSLNIRARFRL